MTPDRFQAVLLEWYDRAGRKDLPWQQQRTPYRVWVSEIMLQQTQVTTVIPYFERFMAVFSSVTVLAEAELDQVLRLWAGLGYYSRARNLHKAAGQVVYEYGGCLPANVAHLTRLSGIGASTAGAIVSLAFNRPAPILDGNVKRLWTRLHGIETWPGEKATERKLWALSKRYLSPHRPADHTQALMDFGATVCTRHCPQCIECPFQTHCVAFLQGRVGQIPAARPRPPRPLRQSFWLLLQDDNERFYLEQRPPEGLWAGLWAFPSWETRQELETHCLKAGIKVKELLWSSSRRHSFSHFDLDYFPALARVENNRIGIFDRPSRWIDAGTDPEVGLPAPVRKLLQDQAGGDVVT